MSAVKAILGNKIMPGKLDEYLAHTAYRAQQTDEPRAAGAPDNLFAPLPGDRGAHGMFDCRARRFSAQLWATKHRETLTIIASALAGLSLGHGAAGHKPPRSS